MSMGINATGRRSISERIRAVRERERVAAELARELPRAHCAGCGGIVPAGQGTIDPANLWARNAEAVAWDRTDAERIKSGRAPTLRWRRRHHGCATSVDIVAALIGDSVSVDVAADALGALRDPVMVSHRYRDVHAADLAMKVGFTAWGHITKRDRAMLRRAVERARAEREPRRCVDGACGWCGRSHAVGWQESPERWSNGSPAPLCGECAAVWDRRGNPTHGDSLRAAALEALTGVAGWGDGGIRCFVDLADDDHDGTAEPWTFAPEALDRLRAEASMTTAERNAEREALYAALARQEAEAEAEAEAAAGWR